ncbi:conserved exported hypothetical protein [Desulfosarcina cetonica]|uniref:SphA family protein n=1 Tax=Desulfosarcina cetonica TaxID=90730 RepID=UPI0006D0D358|nr:transporter [Desulfosarcina cetonica]VTR70266.1 conserved exported hypothetical protein [Desulfosarcina cetonica]
MKKSFFIAVAVSLMLICAPVVQAGCHYVNGVEGIKAATIPPPGFYYRMYNVYLANDEYKDDHGNESGDFDLDVFCQAHRFIWVADYQLLGADFFADIGIPLVYTNIRMGAGDVTWVDENQFGMGDILLEPFALAWHGPRYDAAVALGVYLPVGRYNVNKPNASPGKNYWTGITQFGGTLYLDKEKKWSVSLLARYEINSENSETELTRGDFFSLEWGLGSKLGQGWEIGVAGYSEWQVTDDSGNGATENRTQLSAVGPEINYFLVPLKTNMTLRYLKQFGAKNTSEGSMAILTLTYVF